MSLGEINVCSVVLFAFLPLNSKYHPQFMLALLDHSPDIYLDEIQEELADIHSVNVSLATISRTLKQLGIGSKKVNISSSLLSSPLIHDPQLSKSAAECSEEACHQFQLEIGAETPERIVTTDKSAINILTTYQHNGWAYHGIWAHKRCKFVQGTQFVFPL